MFIRLIARCLDTNEDLLLQGIEPKQEFVWRVRYIRYDNIESFERLEKGKTVLYLYDGAPIIIRENIDKFYERWAEIKKKSDEKEPGEEDIVIELEDDEEENEEESDEN